MTLDYEKLENDMESGAKKGATERNVQTYCGGY